MVKARRAPPTPRHDISASVEDYLKAIYELERDGEAAPTSDIALRLDVAPASVSGMIRRLASQGLLRHVRYRGVRLTAAGRTAALRTLRRHRILECYLTSVLGYKWDRVHDEAERLEHTASDDLIDRMAVALGNPVVDPHGAPIPTREGAVDERRHRSLAELEVGERARVLRVADEDGGFLRYLESMGITPGADVEVAQRAPYDGPLTVRVGRATHGVGATAARQIIVQKTRRREDEKTR